MQKQNDALIKRPFCYVMFCYIWNRIRNGVDKRFMSFKGSGSRVKKIKGKAEFNHQSQVFF